MNEAKMLNCRIIMVEDLSDDIKDGETFGGCQEVECSEDGIKGIFFEIDRMEFNLILCDQHLSELCKLLDRKSTKQIKLDNKWKEIESQRDKESDF